MNPNVKPIPPSPIPELLLGSWDAYLDSLSDEPRAQSFQDHGTAASFSTDSPPLHASCTIRKPFERFTAWEDGPELVVLPPGRFFMGAHPQDRDAAADEKPRHPVEIKQAFAIGIAPITFDQWDYAVAKGGVRHTPTDANWGRGKRPVINVSWHDVEEYLGWLKRETGLAYRLPTESEWEYACWGGLAQNDRYPWGEDDGQRQLEHHAWYYANSNNRSQIVATRTANPWGLFDMLGNIQEWVQDHYRQDYSEHSGDQSPWLTDRRGATRVLRGGSWLDGPRSVRPSARQRWQPDHRSYNSGFRIALTVEIEEK